MLSAEPAFCGEVLGLAWPLDDPLSAALPGAMLLDDSPEGSLADELVLVVSLADAALLDALTSSGGCPLVVLAVSGPLPLLDAPAVSGSLAVFDVLAVFGVLPLSAVLPDALLAACGLVVDAVWLPLLFTPSAANVAWSSCVVSVRPFFAWNALTAFSVRGPQMPSALPASKPWSLSACCASRMVVERRFAELASV